MKNFVNIINLVSNPKEKNISLLKKFYSDIFLLKANIQSIGEGILNNPQIITGKKILLKPNWVLHDRNTDDIFCLRTHDSILLALLEILLKKNPASILIGDAPIQGCDWNKILSNDFLNKVVALSERFKIPVRIKDFRRTTFTPTLNNPVKNRKSLSDYLIFNLCEDSYLEPISTNKNIFRVTCYDPDRLSESHKKGVHKYCITKELFEADVVISIPKVKTHQKTGITCALKNMVGINGDKDFLPHHRIGGTGFGGDCYPGNNILRLWSENLLDMANKRQGIWSYNFFFHTATICWKLSNPKNVHNLAAGWYGNDTTWRMVLDLNKIAVYGKADGTIADFPQRELYCLCDGVIGGQGDGPLNPKQLPLGNISFSNSYLLNDICIATLMGFNYKKIPLLINQDFDLTSPDAEINLNGKKVCLEDLRKYSTATLPPPGWVNHL